MMALMILLLLLPVLPVALYAGVLWREGLRRRPDPATGGIAPTDGLSVLLVCHNEERVLAAKVQALLVQCMQLPVPAFELLVISDGSDDGTETLLQQYDGHPHVRVIAWSQRTGKAHALNVGVAAAQHPLLLLSDARQELSPGALARLHARMQDPHVGAVSACLTHRGRPSLLRRLLNWVKALESRAGSTVGVYGPLYMIRRSCFRPIPIDTVLDDLLISIRVIRQGLRVELEPEAAIYDVEMHRLYQVGRMLRLAGGLRQLARVHRREILGLRPRFVLFRFVQKYLKLLVPVYAVLVLAVFLASGLAFSHLTLHLAWGLPLLVMLCWRDLRLLLKLAWHYLLNLHRLSGMETAKWPRMR